MTQTPEVYKKPTLLPQNIYIIGRVTERDAQTSDFTRPFETFLGTCVKDESRKGDNTLA